MSKNTNLSFLTDYITADITNGRIGINNASPTVAFDVTGVAKFSSSITAADLIISDTYANDPLIKLATTTSGSVEVQMRTATTTYNAGIGVVTSGYDFGLFTNNTTRMTITSAGNVGIGTSSPLQTTTNRTVLTVNGTNQAIINLGYGGNLAAYLYTDNANYSELYSYGQLNFVAAGSQPMTFTTTGGERMRITSGGNILMGTTSDNGGKLQVTGAATFSTSIQSPGMYGRGFTPTSTSGATAYIDTGIALENTAMYILTVYANPAAAGGLYSYNEVGLVNLNSQYNGSTNTNIIKFTRLSISNTSVYPGNLTLSVVFLIGGSEVTQTSSYLPSGQIRIKIDGYSNSTGTSTAAYLTKIG